MNMNIDDQPIIIKRAKKLITINYALGKIYKLVNDVNDKIYIGSTTSTLSRRFSGHKAKALTRNSRIYTSMKEIGIQHFRIILIEDFPCANKAQLEAREYAVTNTFDKERLYNSAFDGKHCDETKKKMSDARLCRGSIHQSEASYSFQWRVDGVQQNKRFSFGNKRTIQQAYMCCLNMRNHIYPMTYEDYAIELPFAEL